MVNIEDILKSKETELESKDQYDEGLDTATITMDVVDTLKKQNLVFSDEISEDDRRRALIDRMRDIYAAQGVDVSDEVLLDGVIAYEEDRFSFRPPKPGLQRSLASLYIHRRRWLPLFYTLAFIIGSVLSINYFGFVRPAQIEAKRIETQLTQTLPDALSTHHGTIISLAQTDDIRQRADALRDETLDAISREDIRTAQANIDQLETLADDLALSYQIRIVSRPGEYSGVFRINEEGDQEVRNYYLIVEGITASGSVVTVNIDSEEDQKSDRVKIWGVRVPEHVFNTVAADKRDDQIIQNAIIGQKERGYLDPKFSVETSGGAILDW